MVGGVEERASLVLGGSGFLGAHLLRVALAEWMGPLIAVLRARSTFPADLSGAPGLAFQQLDVARAPRIDGLLDRLRPARILNAAALARADECERRPELARLLNVALPESLARWCAKCGARLVHVSSDLVYGRRPAPPGGFREEHPTDPLGRYGESKAAGERAVLERCPSALVVRLPLLYGDSGGRGLGASDSLAKDVARGERPGLFTDEWRTPLSVEDAARALVELCASDSRSVLHVAGPERLDRLELGLAMLEARGLSRDEASALVRPARRAEHRGPPRAEDTSLDSSRARAILRTKLHGVREGLARSASRPRPTFLDGGPARR